jgi:hypothetical protein
LAHETDRTTLEGKIATNATFDEDELTGAERRMYRARNDRMVVVPQVGADQNATGLYNVYSESGNTYLVDIVGGEKCTCPDMKHNQPAGGCKHIRRVLFMLEETALPAAGEPVEEFFDTHLTEMARELRAEREALERRKQTLGFFFDGLREEFETASESESVLTTPEE